MTTKELADYHDVVDEQKVLRRLTEELRESNKRISQGLRTRPTVREGRLEKTTYSFVAGRGGK